MSELDTRNNMSTDYECINETMLYTHNRKLLGLKKEGNSDTCTT
jgi:hypothetical protein